MNKMYILVDGANVAFSRKIGKNKARFANLEIMLRFLEGIKANFAIDYEIIADATLKHRIDDASHLEAAYKSGKIIECPAGVKADEFIIEFVNENPNDVIVISNDNFTEYNPEKLPALAFCKFLVIFDAVIILNFKHLFTGTFQEFESNQDVAMLNRECINPITRNK